MVKDINAIAARLGAVVVGQVPDVGGGAFGAARLARIVSSMRTAPAESPARAEVLLSAGTIDKLTRLAERASTPEQKISPMQLASHLLEEAVAGLPDS